MGSLFMFSGTSHIMHHSWDLVGDYEEALTYTVAVWTWDADSRVCGISYEFGISGELVGVPFDA